MGCCGKQQPFLEILMNKEKETTQGISVEDNEFLKWFDNYWYHHKWITIGVAFALIVVVICTFQTCSRSEGDIDILYAGPCLMNSEQYGNLSTIFGNVLPEDYNEDGEKNVVIHNYHIYSKEQIKEITAETDEYGVHGFVDTNYNSNQYDTYSNYILTGESSVLLLDPWLYEALRDNSQGVLMELSEVFEIIPESNLDGYGVRLGDTDIYQEYAALRVLPEDTVICLLRPLLSGKSAKESNYRIEKEMYAALTGAEGIKNEK